jgi:hypothetical protein
MARYTLASRTTNVTTGQACWELRSTATDRLFVRELGITLAAATASTFGLGRPAAIGVTPTAPVTVVAMDPGDPAGTGTVALAWGTGPTIPAAFLRRIGLPATIGSGIIWTFGERGLVVPASSSVILWNLSATGVSDVYVEIDE